MIVENIEGEPFYARNASATKWTRLDVFAHRFLNLTRATRAMKELEQRHGCQQHNTAPFFLEPAITNRK